MMSYLGLHWVQVDIEHAERRIDNFLLNYLQDLPKSRLYRLLRKGEVRVNRKRIRPDYRLQAEDIIRIPPMHLDASSSKALFSVDSYRWLEEQVLFEDDALLIVNKPSGLAVHGGGSVRYGLIQIWRALRPHLPYLELVHRLDQPTSGCLILAKKPSVLRQLHGLLVTNQLKKRYIALVQGQWPCTTSQAYRCQAPLLKCRRGDEAWVRVDPEGKSADTLFSLEQRFTLASVVNVDLLTGRTHQIRVHAAHCGHPIAGDERYGDKVFNRMMKQKKLNRLFLHASEIEFTLPGKQRAIIVSAPLPDDLVQCIARLRVCQ